MYVEARANSAGVATSCCCAASTMHRVAVAPRASAFASGLPRRRIPARRTWPGAERWSRRRGRGCGCDRHGTGAIACTRRTRRSRRGAWRLGHRALGSPASSTGGGGRGRRRGVPGARRHRSFVGPREPTLVASKPRRSIIDPPPEVFEKVSRRFRKPSRTRSRPPLTGSHPASYPRDDARQHERSRRRRLVGRVEEVARGGDGALGRRPPPRRGRRSRRRWFARGRCIGSSGRRGGHRASCVVVVVVVVGRPRRVGTARRLRRRRRPGARTVAPRASRPVRDRVAAYGASFGWRLFRLPAPRRLRLCFLRARGGRPVDCVEAREERAAAREGAHGPEGLRRRSLRGGSRRRRHRKRRDAVGRRFARRFFGGRPSRPSTAVRPRAAARRCRRAPVMDPHRLRPGDGGAS